jgi:predicted nuclease of predicted toxin-antitoxin system
MKLVVDMNLPPRWIGFLAANNVDAVHWSTVGDPRASDAQSLTLPSGLAVQRLG